MSLDRDQSFSRSNRSIRLTCGPLRPSTSVISSWVSGRRWDSSPVRTTARNCASSSRMRCAANTPGIFKSGARVRERETSKKLL